MNFYFRLFADFLFLAFIFFPVSASMASDRKSIDAAVDTIQKTYDNVRTLQADFMQLTFQAGSSEGIRASGKVWFKPPEAMRWEYEQPERQVIVTSGKDVYIYEQEARQVTIVSRRHFLSTEISRAFFFGKGDVRKSFDITMGISGGKPDPLKLVLVPKEENPQVKRITVTLDSRSGLVRELWFEDNFGGRTRLLFTDITLNSRLDDSMFQFIIPSGVEVYRSE